MKKKNRYLGLNRAFWLLFLLNKFFVYIASIIRRGKIGISNLSDLKNFLFFRLKIEKHVNASGQASTHNID